MFGLDAVSISTKDRASGPHFLSEILATLGLMLVIFALARSGRASSAAAAVGAYIGAAYFFTKPRPARHPRPPSPTAAATPAYDQPDRGEMPLHVVMIGGSDAGISAALRIGELDPAADVTVVLADAYPNFSICGIPYYVSGEVSHWRNLAHRTIADLEAAGMTLRPDTTARRIDVAGRTVRSPGPAAPKNRSATTSS